MRRRFMLALATPLAWSVSAGYGATQTLTWRPFPNADGRYTLEMPTPVLHRTDVRPDGVALRQALFVWGDNGLNFTVYELAHRETEPEAAEIAALFAKFQNHVRQTWPGSTVVEQIEIRLGAAGGRSLRLRVDDGTRLLTARIYYQGNRFYELIAVSAAAEHEGPVVTRFLDALRIFR